MSFILEALKKSEQKREQQGQSPKKLRKRTLSLSSDRPERRLLPWLLCACLLLLLLGGWLFFPRAEAPLEPAVVAVQEPKAATASPQPVATAVAEPIPGAASEPQKTTLEAEQAPIPRPIGVSQADSAETSAERSSGDATASRQVVAPIPQKLQRIEKPAATVVMEQAEPHAANREVAEPAAAKLPLYSELPREWRDRMPNLEMSLLFYTPEPSRRIVRINDHLLHEGSWVDRNLQVVEITPTGAVLDYLGKTFELRRNRR